MKLLFDDQRNILLVKFEDALTSGTLEEMYTEVRHFIAAHGMCRGILDFTDVPGVDITSPYIVHKAQDRPLFEGEARVIVASNDLLYGLARMFQLTQKPGDNPSVVRSMQEAYTILNINNDNFNLVG
jgi:hypothetical protein